MVSLLNCCKRESCTEKVYCKELCKKHYMEEFYIKKVGQRTKFKHDGCKVSGCNKPHKSKGYCNKHYSRFKKWGTIDREEISKVKIKEGRNCGPGTKRAICKIEGCNEHVASGGYCRFHASYYVMTHRYLHFKSQSKRRGIEVKLTLDQYSKIVDQSCYYCNMKRLERGAGLDRVENNKGYEIDNVVPCCGYCNFFRNNMLTTEEAKNLISQLRVIRKKEDPWENMPLCNTGKVIKRRV